MGNWTVLIVLFILLLHSLWVRICRFRQGTDAENKESPLSRAIQEMVATAGGIYLSLIMLISFLKLNIPDKFIFYQITIDPVALTSIGLTILQPLYFKFKK